MTTRSAKGRSSRKTRTKAQSRRKSGGGLFGPAGADKERSELVKKILTNDIKTIEQYLEETKQKLINRHGWAGEERFRNLLNKQESRSKTPIFFTITKGSGQCVKPFKPEIYTLLRNMGADYDAGVNKYASDCGVTRELREEEDKIHGTANNVHAHMAKLEAEHGYNTPPHSPRR
jgi:hypothetical protein